MLEQEPSRRERLKLVRKKHIRRKEPIEELIETEVEAEVETIEGGPKIIKRYPKQRCVVPECHRNAVGSGDTCKRHGGESLVRENLVPATIMPNSIKGNTYDPVKHPAMYIELASQGMSEVEIAAEIGVGVSTLQRWSEKFTEFNTVYEIGAALHEAWWLQQGKENLDNRGYNVGLYKFLTGNKLGYSDKIESKNLHVHAGVLKVPGTSTEEDWEKEYAKKT